jgi:hypothetical protein
MIEVAILVVLAFVFRRVLMLLALVAIIAASL